MTATMAYQRSPMTTFIPWICVALIFSASIQGVKSNDVEINPTGSVVVREGDPLKIMCRVGPKIKSCRVAIPNEGSMILSKEDAFTGNIEYDGLGTQAGECGVKILRVKDSYDGDFHCFVTTYESRVETNASVTIVVAKPPQRPEIHLNPAPPAEGYTFGQEVEIICLARWGRPAANLSMYLDDEPIDYSSKLKYYGSNSMKNATTIERNVTRKLDWTDHGKVIRCVADHIALDHPMESKRELNVIFAPRHEDIPKQFGYVIGRRGIVNVTVYANPKPTFVWKIGGVEIPEHRSDEENRLQTSSAVDLGKGAWVVQLTIDPVQKSDTEKEYILEARNVRGMYAYRIFLSTSAEPAGVDLDAGSIIGIAVGALVLILIVFLIIFARATGRWCFAGGSVTRNIGETSDTESAGRYSRSEVDGAETGKSKRPRLTFSKLFKRNKDKVSGADTDTVRTVVTLDDEKVHSAESGADSQRTNPSTEGGIVYAELDLTQQQQGIPPRRVSDDKTEYAEIVYAKTAEGETPSSIEK